MDDRPLAKPAHLRDTPKSPKEWLASRPIGLAALVLGLIAFAVAAILNDPMWSTPDWRITVPGFVLTAIASAASIARKERAWGLWLVGIGLAGAALVLGWFLLVALVIGATALLMLILNSVM